MTELNGKHTPPPDDLTLEIAQDVFTALADEEESFDGLSGQEAADEVFLAEHYVQAHLRALHRRGFRIVPKGAVAIPTCDEEAAAYVAAARQYAESKRRKGGLLANVTPKLILPNGGKLQ